VARAVVVERERDDGSVSFQVRWWTWEGTDRRQFSRTFSSRDEAEKEVARRVLDVPDAGAMTVGQLLDRWAEYYPPPSAHSRYNYARSIEKTLKPALGHLRLRDLTALDIEAWVLRGLQRGKPNTVLTAAQPLRQALRRAVLWRLIPFDPALGVEWRRIPRVARTEALTLDEARRFLVHVRGHRFEAFWRLMIVGGMRSGEVVALKWEDIDWELGVVVVSRTMTKGEHGTRQEGQTTKGKRARVVGLDARTRAVLEPLRGEGWVFTVNGRWLWPAEVSAAFNDVKREAGLPAGVQMRDLRRTSSSLDQDMGRDVRDVSKRLGHASQALTSRVYTVVSAERRRKEAEELATALDEG
jgi:integrase